MAGTPARFDKSATADQVLAGVDLSDQTILLTGCASGIGFETMRALAARGAHVIGTARSTARASEACRRAGGHTTPIVCDQEDLASVAGAAQAIRQLGSKLDAIIGNAGIMAPPQPDLRYDVEGQFRVNHLSHMLLVMRIADLLRDGTGRLVMVSSSAAQMLAPREGIAFDNLDTHAGYKPLPFYGQSKLANLTFAKSMAARLQGRGITSNALHPGVIASTDLGRSMGGLMRLAWPLIGLFSKSIPQGAATQCYLAAHPDLNGVTGAFYADCRPSKPNPHADDPAFQQRLWSISETLLDRHAPA